MKPKREIRNQLFYDALTKLVDVTIQKYCDLDKSDLPVRPIVKLREEGSKTRYESLERPAYEIIVMKNISVQQLQEFKDCILLIRNDEILSGNYHKLIEIDNSMGTYFSDSTLFLLSSKALGDYDNNTDYKRNFLNSYLDLEELIYGNRIPIVLTIPIHNLSFDGEISIDSGILLKRLTAAEKEQFYNTNFLPHTIPFDFRHFKVILQLKYEVNKKFGYDDGSISSDSDELLEMSKKLNCLIYSLEILREGCFEFLGHFKNIDLDIPIQRVGFISMSSGTTCRGSYDLNSINPTDLTKTYSAVFLLVQHKIVSNALEWFDSYTKERDENKKVIFMTIVIETLFTKTGEHDLLTHKIGSRIARFIEQDFNQREEIYDNIKEFYNLRSLILHGENVEDMKLKDKRLRKYLESDGLNHSKKYVRKAILDYIHSAEKFSSDVDIFIKDHEMFIKKLDLA